MTEKEIIKPVSFGKRLKKYSLIPYYLHLLSTYGNLKELILARKMEGLDQILIEMTPYVMAEMKEEERQKAIQTFKEKAEEMNRKEIDSFMPILFNQALVMACTTIDVFLVDALRVITQKKPNILKGLAGKESIDIAQVIDLADYQKIFEFIQAKVLKKFDYGSIEDKIKTFDKLGVDTAGAFSFKHHNEKVQMKYPNAQDLLISTYQKRHGIVHADQLPLTTYKELEEITTFYDNLMLSFGIELGRHFSITTDWHLLISGDVSFLND